MVTLVRMLPVSPAAATASAPVAGLRQKSTVRKARCGCNRCVGAGDPLGPLVIGNASDITGRRLSAVLRCCCRNKSSRPRSSRRDDFETTGIQRPRTLIGVETRHPGYVIFCVRINKSC